MSRHISDQTVIAVGYGLLPSGTATGQLYHVMTIAAEVDRESHMIMDASITLITDVSARWIRSCMAGNDLTSDEDTAEFIQRVENGFLGNSQRALIHAYRDMVQRYREHFGLVG
ncbi:MAG: hypothetical protein Kow00129_05090 [Thermoleophilia bacterium]